MTRRQRRRVALPQQHVITVINDDDSDDENGEPVPVAPRTQVPAQQEVVDLAGPSPPSAAAPDTVAARAVRRHAAAASPDADHKRARRAAPPPAAAAPADADEAGNDCTICYDLMSEAGEHRPAALRCGHIFGEACIKRWLREKHRCPQCNKKAQQRDITTLFNLPTKVAAGSGADAAELQERLQRAQQRAEQEQQRVKQLEHQLQEMRKMLQWQQRHHAPQQQARHAAHPAPQPQPHPPPSGVPVQPPLAYALPLAGGLGLQLPPALLAVVPDPAWSAVASRIMSHQPVPPEEFQAFLRHPNTVMYLQQAQMQVLQPPLLPTGQAVGQAAAAAPAHPAGPPAPDDQLRPQHGQQQQQLQHAQQQQLQQSLHRQQQGQQQQLQQLPQGQQQGQQQQLQQGQQQLQQGQQQGQQQQLQQPLRGQQPGQQQQLQYLQQGQQQQQLQLPLLPGEQRHPSDRTLIRQLLPEQQHSVPDREPLQQQQQQVPAQAGPLIGHKRTLADLGPTHQGNSMRQHEAAGGSRGPQVLELCLLPVRAAGGGAVGAHTTQLPGSFDVLQDYALKGSRAFDLDVNGTLLTVAEAAGPWGPGTGALRRISMLAPGAPTVLLLPANAGLVRCLARQLLLGPESAGGAALMAVATDRAGLVVAKPSTNNIIATIPTQAPVWSVAWSSSNTQQLLLGLDRGRVALVDLRMTGSRALVLMTGAPAGSRPAFQPWHSMVALPAGWVQQHAGGAAGVEAVAPDALMACTAGVYSWSAAQPEAFQLLLSSSWHGGPCESLALDPDSNTLAASFRRPLGPATSTSSIQPAHWLAQLAPASAAADIDAAAAAALTGTQGALQQGMSGCVAAAVAAGRQQLLSGTLKLSGHSSMQQMTRGCFMPALPGLPGERLLFASADEDSCQVRLWGSSSGAALAPHRPPQQPRWWGCSSPVLQLAGGTSSAFGTTLLAALSDRELKVSTWAANAQQ